MKKICGAGVRLRGFEGPTIRAKMQGVPITRLRERVLGDLREEGYTFQEIAQLLGITRQRADQIEKRIGRGRNPAKSRTKTQERNWFEGSAKKQPGRVRVITPEDFARRLAKINRYYEERVDLILSGRLKARRQTDRGCIKNRSTDLIEKVRRGIRRYKGEPFHLSELVGDCPELVGELYLPQMLYRLRRRGLLRNLGYVRLKRQSVPEILLAEAPAEDYATKLIEAVAQRWSEKLLYLAKHYRPTRPAVTIHQVRRYFVQKLSLEGYSKSEIDSVFRARIAKDAAISRLNCDWFDY